MQLGDLTTIAKVKGWLNTGASAFPGTDDPLLGRLITAASQWVQSYLSRKIPAADYTYVTNGLDTASIYLPVQPVINVAFVMIDGVVIPVAPAPQPSAFGTSGYLFDNAKVYVRGYRFTRGIQNVTIGYSGGFQISGESQPIPNDNTYQIPVANLMHPWCGDRGITVAGVALVPVAASPAPGQYSIITVSGSTAFGYQFNAAQAGLTASISYAYTPEDLEQALIELIGERYKYRTRVGVNSQNMGQGMIASFMNKDMSENVRTTLSKYMNVVPQSQ